MKTLGKILLTCAAITTGSLFLLGCPPKKGVSQKIQDLTEAVVEDIYGEGSYQEALDIANNPSKYFSGNVVKEESKPGSVVTEEVTKNIPSTQLSPKTDKVLVEPKEVVREFPRPPKNLEDYFFKGEEMNGLEILTSGQYLGMPTGRLYFSEELFEMKKFLNERRFNTNYADSLKNLGMMFYAFKRDKNTQDYIDLIQTVCEFDSKSENFKFLEQFMKGENDWLLFVNKNMSSIIYFDNIENIEQERTLVDSLIKYEKRTLGDFYLGSSDLSWHTLDETYRKLGISQSESGFYFRQAMEFQRGLYDAEIETEKQLQDVLSRDFDFGLFRKEINRYIEGTIDDNQLKRSLQAFGNEIGRKHFFMFPNLQRKEFAAIYKKQFEVPDKANFVEFFLPVHRYLGYLSQDSLYQEDVQKVSSEIGISERDVEQYWAWLFGDNIVSRGELEQTFLSSQKSLELELYFSLLNWNPKFEYPTELDKKIINIADCLGIIYNDKYRKQYLDEIDKQRQEPPVYQ